MALFSTKSTMLRAALGYFDRQLQSRDDDDDDEKKDGQTNSSTSQKPGGPPQTTTIVLIVLFTIAMTLIFVFVFLFWYRRRQRRRVSINDSNGGERLGMFNFTRRRGSFRNSDYQSSTWWGGRSVRSGEATVPPSITSFDDNFIDHDGSTVRGERLTRVRKSLLRDYHGYRP